MKRSAFFVKRKLILYATGVITQFSREMEQCKYSFEVY